MAYTTPRTWTYGETVTEAQFNEQIRDNFNALWVGTTAGDMDYYTSSTTKARLAGGTANAGKFIRQVAGGTALEYANGGGISSRQGGSADNWSIPGTVNYEISESLLMQTGVCQLSFAGANYAAALAHVTFGTEFSKIPIILLSWGAKAGPSSHIESVYTYDNGAAYTTTTAGFYVDGVSAAACTATLYVKWLAIGAA